MLRSLVALCVLFPIQLVAADWYAVFWNSTLKAELNSTFRDYNQITSNDKSSFLFQCDHTTIAFQPADITPYTPRLGEKQTAHILAYAHDEHGQAILLRYDSANPIPTLNAFPHTTISVQNSGPYSAVYSNDLWARVNASGYVNITFFGGFPATIAFVDMTNVVNNTLNFTLPAITIGTNNYTATVVQVVIPPPDYTWFELEGTFCANSLWNSTTAVCAQPPAATTATPTTPAPTTPAPTTAAPTTPVPVTIAPTTATPTRPSNTTNSTSTWKYVPGDCMATCGFSCDGIKICAIDIPAKSCKCVAESGAVTGIVIGVLIGIGVLMFACCFVLRCGIFSYRQTTSTGHKTAV